MAAGESNGGRSRFFLAVGLLFLASFVVVLVLVLLGGEAGQWRQRSFDLLSLAAGAAISFGAMRSSRIRRWILSMRVGLIVLVIIAAASLIGVIFTQGASPQEYVARFGNTGYRILNFLGVLRVFHVWWYKGLLLLLTYLVTSCALRRARTLLRMAFKPTFHLKEQDYKGSPAPGGLRLPMAGAEATEKVLGFLSKRGYRATSRRSDDGAIGLFAARGRFSHLGTLGLHLSLVFILGGGYVAATVGFRYMQWGRAGETFGIEGVDFEVRVDSFSIETTPTGQIKDYLTDLTVLEEGREVLRKTIEVNVPLKYGGINIYQSSYRNDPRAVRTASFQLEDGEGQVILEDLELPFGEPVKVPDVDLTLEATDYAADFVIDTSTRQVRSRSQDPRNPAIKVRFDVPGEEPYEEWLFLSGIDMHRKENPSYRLRFRDLEPQLSTGLEVAYQPALILVWIGFVLMTLGVILSLYLNHRRLWALIQADEAEGQTTSRLYLGGSSNRDQEGWDRILKDWAASLKQVD